MKKLTVILCIVLILSGITEVGYCRIWKKKIKSIEELEKWKIYKELYCSEKIKVKYLDDGKYMLFHFNAPNKNSFAKYKLVLPSADLRGMKKLKIVLNNLSENEIDVSFAFITKSGNKWWELPIKKLKTGINTIEYELDGNIFGTKKNGWRYTDSIKGENNITGFGLCIYPLETGEGVIR